VLSAALAASSFKEPLASAAGPGSRIPVSSSSSRARWTSGRSRNRFDHVFELPHSARPVTAREIRQHPSGSSATRLLYWTRYFSTKYSKSPPVLPLRAGECPRLMVKEFRFQQVAPGVIACECTARQSPCRPRTRRESKSKSARRCEPPGRRRGIWLNKEIPASAHFSVAHPSTSGLPGFAASSGWPSGMPCL
jgi:hypothetical protein